jgi:DNA polymerase-3 subunit delta
MVFTADSPVVSILHGDDEFAMARTVASLCKAMGDPLTADMNTVKLEGSQTTPGEIKTAAATVPFLASHRLVIVDHPLARIAEKDKEAQNRFTGMLDSLPSTAFVVLVIEDYQEKKKWKLLPPESWLFTWAKNSVQRVSLQEMRSPERKNMAGWILREAKQQGGEFKPGAAVALADQIDNDTRFAAQEITKLLTYVNFLRAVEREDVEMLTSGKTQVSIFDLTDALTERNTRKALTLLHQLMEQEDPRNIFAMVTRQFRQLIQTREIMDEGGKSADIMNAGLSSGQLFIAEKLFKQAGSFRMPRLKDIYHRLLAFDIGTKTSELSPALALDLLIVEVTG